MSSVITSLVYWFRILILAFLECILVVYGDLDFRLVKKKKQMDIYFIDKPEAESQSKIPSQIKNKEMGIGPLGCH